MYKSSCPLNISRGSLKMSVIEWMVVSLTIIPHLQFHIIHLQVLPDEIYGISCKTQISKLKKKLNQVNILMPDSLSGDLHWF